MTTSFPAAPLTWPVGAPPAFHLLSKPTGAICNLDCAYCFFLDKEVFYPGSEFRMSDDVLEQYIRQLIESHQTDAVNIAWQGGEPTLMGLDFYWRVFRLFAQYVHAAWPTSYLLHRRRGKRKRRQWNRRWLIPMHASLS